MCTFDVSLSIRHLSRTSVPDRNIQVFTSKRPWGAISDDRIYQLVVKEDERPDRPEPDPWGNEIIPDGIWDIMKKAWAKESRARPDFVKIISLWPQAGPSTESTSPILLQPSVQRQQSTGKFRCTRKVSHF